MPDTLAQKVRAKYPGAYDDLSDADLEAKVSAKHPGAYDDLPRSSAPSTAAAAPRFDMSKVPVDAEAAFAESAAPVVSAWAKSGPGAVVEGARDVGRGNFAKGGRQMLSGAAITAAPAVLPQALTSIIASPLAAAAGLGGGLAAQQAVQGGGRALGLSGDQAGLAGDVAGLIGGAGAYKATPRMVSGLTKIPGAMARGMGISSERAGQNIQAATRAASGVLVNTEVAGQSGLRMMDLKAAGGRMPRAAEQFLRRATDPAQPDLTFEEARDFYSNLSRLSANEYGTLNPTMQRQLGTMTKALHQALVDSAETVGAGGQYQQGISEYAKAARAKARWEQAKPLLMKSLAAAAGAGGAYQGWKALTD